MLLVEVERGLADDHQAEGGDIGFEPVVLVLSLEIHQDLERWDRCNTLHNVRG